jgi:hypothetical protein
MSTTPNLLISHIAASQNQKEVTANTGFDEFDEALCSLMSIAMTNVDYTFSASNFLYNFVFVFTGALTADRNIIVTANKKPFVVSNQTTGGYNLIVKVGSATSTVIVPPDSKYYIMYCDGTNSIHNLRSAVISSAALQIATDARTTTSEAIADSDRGKLVTFSNSSAVAATIAQAGNASRFISGWFAWLENKNVGEVTLTPTTSTINGAATLILRQNEGVLLVSDGTNYQTFRGKSSLPQYTVANLPTDASEGDITYATNGLKSFESTGNGTGVPVYFSSSNPSIGGLWRVFSTDAQVQS